MAAGYPEPDVPARRGDRSHLPVTPLGGLCGHPRGHRPGMFLFFNNRLGCLGSLLVSAVLTVVLFLLLSR